MRWSKFFVTSLILGFVVVGGGYLFLTSSPAEVPGVVIPSSSEISYENSKYGFNFPLPDTWKGFTVVTSTWEGSVDGKTVATGSIVSIRNPLWTEEKPYQDISVMIFTVDQWNDMTAGKFHIGAAPINPSEFGRNANYVFALPARYNFAYPLGVEEVEQILSTKPLQAF